MSENTVKYHLKRLFQTFGAVSRSTFLAASWPTDPAKPRRSCPRHSGTNYYLRAGQRPAPSEASRVTPRR